MDSKYCPNCGAYFEDVIDYNNHVIRCWSNANNSDHHMMPINTERPESSSKKFDEHHFGLKISAVNTFPQEGVRNFFHISTPSSVGILNINVSNSIYENQFPISNHEQISTPNGLQTFSVEGCNQSFENSNSICSTNHLLNAGDSLQERLFSNLPLSENPRNSALSDSIFTVIESVSNESEQGIMDQMFEKPKYSTNEEIPSSSNILPSYEKSFPRKFFNNFSSNQMFLNRGRLGDNNPINNSFPEKESSRNVNFEFNSIATDFRIPESENEYLNRGSSIILSNNNSYAAQSPKHNSFPENQIYNSTFTNAFLPEVESSKENESHGTHENNTSVCCRKAVKVQQNTTLSVQKQVTAKTRNSRLCSQSFKNKYDNKNDSDRQSGVKSYCCRSCNERFLTSYELEKHKAIHAEEGEFVCKECSKTFATKSGLNQHIRAHTFKKQFYCTECSKIFSHKCSLDRHIRIHTGEKPYRHMRVHTGEKEF
ncbi:hypothetical protein NPIL_355981 [Nephila pilipes]|uniref:C2H2-type domain-containing protein n=1 Tax=Nephila pilipes TaxID=299642 RepID=A0A8X6ULL7_NEPPI|nr:hypothetical protein NPIL_355981 [Nephila pilipes]